mgnify:CR=1 FL=1
MSNGLSKARFLTVQEVADLMRVSSMTVYRLIKSGELPAVRVGRSFRVAESDDPGRVEVGGSAEAGAGAALISLATAGGGGAVTVTFAFCRSLYWPLTTTRSPSRTG